MTGPGGFVGSCLANRLVELGAKVTVVLRDLPGGNNFALLGLRDRVNIVNRSVTDLGLVERALNEYEVVICFHLAAQAIVGVATACGCQRGNEATSPANLLTLQATGPSARMWRASLRSW